MITADIQELIATEVPDWASIAPVRLLDRSVDAMVTHLEDEQQRRRALGLGALDDSNLLRVLYELPVGAPVARSSLSKWEIGVLRRSPQGAVELTREEVKRLACPPLKVELVMVRARDWERGIFWASQYGPFCRRILVLPALPESQRERDGLELEARMFGIGVIGDQDAHDGWLIPPAPFQPERLSSGQWLFQERAYAALLQAGVVTR